MKEDKNQLVFVLYNDDVELTNPIGSNRNKHKISSVSILNAINF